ncbi:MAG: hypothetical protein Ta2A_18000 [Treponemataceae bacterium]|nr:MAG: hypothetical protein Ta2A_18000 [Treponemataceae bacterium]
MGRKRLKNRLIRRVIRYGKKGIPKDSPQKRQDNPFDDPWFWLNIAMMDFCGFFGIGADTQRDSRPNKECN